MMRGWTVGYIEQNITSRRKPEDTQPTSGVSPSIGSREGLG